LFICAKNLLVETNAPQAPTLEKRIREALATPGQPGVRVIAKQAAASVAVG
jgi:hypothetical protein